jgi:hypothetical protein
MYRSSSIDLLHLNTNPLQSDYYTSILLLYNLHHLDNSNNPVTNQHHRKALVLQTSRSLC